AGELKTKPTQHSVQALREIGIIPDIILCRCESSLSEEIKDKISLFCNVPKQGVIDVTDASSIYEVPMHLFKQGLDEKICDMLGLDVGPADLSSWQAMLFAMHHPKDKIVIGIVGKYLQHHDAYKSVFEAIQHSAIAHQVEAQVRCFEPDKAATYE